MLPCACAPASTAQVTEFVVHVAANGDVLVASERIYSPAEDQKPLRIAMHEASQAMPRSTSSSHPNEADGTVVIRAVHAAPFGSVVEWIEVCRLHGIDIWKFELALEDAARSVPGFGLTFPSTNCISCGPDDPLLRHVALVEAPAKETLTLSWWDRPSLEEEDDVDMASDELVRLLGGTQEFPADQPASRLVVIEASAPDVATFPVGVLDTNYLCMTASANAACGDVFAVLRALRERGIEQFEFSTR